jgi:hypothetical protein
MTILRQVALGVRKTHVNVKKLSPAESKTLNHVKAVPEKDKD